MTLGNVLGGWTLQEIVTLEELALTTGDWSEKAERLPGRTPEACRLK